MMLEGLPLEQACEMLEAAGAKWRVTSYQSRRPYEGADSRRVVRAGVADDGAYELVVCEFKTKVNDASQGSVTLG